MKKSDLQIDQLYTVDDVVELTSLRRARISALFKKYNVAKIGNKYFATSAQVKEIMDRPVKTFKLINMREADEK